MSVFRLARVIVPPATALAALTVPGPAGVVAAVAAILTGFLGVVSILLDIRRRRCDAAAGGVTRRRKARRVVR